MRIRIQNSDGHKQLLVDFLYQFQGGSTSLLTFSEYIIQCGGFGSKLFSSDLSLGGKLKLELELPALMANDAIFGSGVRFRYHGWASWV